MVTAEFAVVLPAVVILLATALAGLSCVIDQVRCVDAARVAARAASRGDATSAVVAAGSALAPAGSTVHVAPTGAGSVTVRVEAPSRPWLGGLPDALRPRSEATMPLEIPVGDGAVGADAGGGSSPAGTSP